MLLTVRERCEGERVGERVGEREGGRVGGREVFSKKRSHEEETKQKCCLSTVLPRSFCLDRNSLEEHNMSLCA